MKIKITNNNLQRFSNKLNVDFSDLSNNLADSIAQEGVEIAKGYYAGTKIDVSVEPLEAGHNRVVASGDQVAYMEFGTGEYARGTYQGKLPTQPITFTTSSKKTITTNGWEYYYNNPDTKVTVNGKKGWYLNNNAFVTGRPAGNQMFYTSQDLRSRIKKIVKNLKRR